MFTQMAQQLLQRHEPGAEPNSIDLDSYLDWQRNHTFEALQNIRYGQSFAITLTSLTIVFSMNVTGLAVTN